MPYSFQVFVQTLVLGLRERPGGGSVVSHWIPRRDPLVPGSGVGSLSRLAVATVVLAGQEARRRVASGAPRRARSLCSAGGDTALAEDRTVGAAGETEEGRAQVSLSAPELRGRGGAGGTETSSLHPPPPSQSPWEAAAQETRDSCGRLQLLLRRYRCGEDAQPLEVGGSPAPPLPAFAFRALSRRGAAPPRPRQPAPLGGEDQGDPAAVSAGGRAEPRSPAPRLGKG